ncbi:ABC-type multidrug transport system ATPase subunit [Crossiella equi]|uniref:ABC-type multidrug transport system ATPase subunit n=1 Tax=Crossiella equi TaxID=130796 RepID=A0ABS5AQD4_9PSEU|nr:ABC-type multidrug transport system ATPase subunit [Crossiella equi]
MPVTEPVIEVDSLHKRYRDRVAVADVSFTVARGEIFGVLGRNGAGKTTTVECVTGLRRPDGGRITVLGRDVRREAAALRTRNLPSQVLVLTTYDADHDVLPAIEAGATGYLLKDAPRQDLFRAVEAAARGESVLSPAVAATVLGRLRTPPPRRNP